MSDYYDTEGDDYLIAMQRRINDGSIWLFEGSAGRAAMELLDAGVCLLPKTRTRDYWGNTIPARTDLKPGTKGTWQRVVETRGRSWAQRMARA